MRDGIGMGRACRQACGGRSLPSLGRGCSSPWPPSRSRHQLLDQDVLTSICGRAEGGRWELASATGIGAARPGAAGSVGSAGGLVVHGGAGGQPRCEIRLTGTAFARSFTAPSLLPEPSLRLKPFCPNLHFVYFYPKILRDPSAPFFKKLAGPARGWSQVRKLPRQK